MIFYQKDHMKLMKDQKQNKVKVKGHVKIF